MPSRSLPLKTLALLLLKVLVTGGCLTWAFSQIDVHGNALDHLKLSLSHPAWLLAGITLAGCSLFLAAVSWQLLLKAQDLLVPFREIVRLTLYSALFNLVSVGSLSGDAAKLLTLARKFPQRKMAISLSIAIDHLAGFIATALIFLCATWTSIGQDTIDSLGIRHLFTGLTIFFLAALILISLTFVLSNPKVDRHVRRVFPRFSEKPFVRSMVTTYDVFRKEWRLGLAAILTSIPLNAFYFLTFYVGIRSLGEHADLGRTMAAMPIVDIISALPISLNGLGVREKTFEFLMADLTSLAAPAAVSASLLGFFFNFFWGLVGGVLFLTRRPS